MQHSLKLEKCIFTGPTSRETLYRPSHEQLSDVQIYFSDKLAGHFAQ